MFCIFFLFKKTFFDFEYPTKKAAPKKCQKNIKISNEVCVTPRLLLKISK